MEQNNSIIGQYDQVIAQKAARSEVEDVLIKLRKYVKTETYDEDLLDMSQRVSKLDQKTTSVKEDVDYVS